MVTTINQLLPTPDTYTQDLGGFYLGIIKQLKGKVPYLITLFLGRKIITL